MIRYSRFPFVIIVFVLSCSGNPKPPKGIMPPEKMQSVLYDLLKADEYAGYKAFSDSSFKTKTGHTNLYQTIFRIHHTSRDEFNRSLRYYQGRPDLLKTMFDSLQSRADREVHADSAINARFVHKPDTSRRPLLIKKLHAAP